MTDITQIFKPLPLRKFIDLCTAAARQSLDGNEQQLTIIFRRGRVVLFLTSKAVVADRPDEVMDSDYQWRSND